MQVTTQARNRVDEILGFCEEPKSRREIQEHLDIKKREYFSVKSK